MTARGRWLALGAVRLLGVAGALLGVALIAKAHMLAPKLLGGALILSAIYFGASVPLAMAHRWRTPEP